VIDALGTPQSALVLGGGSEIARATVRLLAARGMARVVLAGRLGASSVAAAAKEATAAGAQHVAIEAFEASAPDTHGAVVAEWWERHGDFDLVLVAFGMLGDQPALEADPSSAAPLATVNFTAAVTTGLAVAGHLRRQGHGRLVALSSVAGERVRRANFVYGATKAGMDAFFQGLGDALAGTGAGVTIVRPGFVIGGMTEHLPPPPRPFTTTPEAVAHAIALALSRRRAVVWVPAGLRLIMSVGRHAPRSAWRRVPG
jgi:decaprenylphospho-beta-D-erythro-pentofuranosid-2-ulose 2-reductase